MAKTNLEEYAQLRTILDSLEIGALRYYLNPTDPKVRSERLEYLTKQLMPIVNKIWGTGPTKKKKKGLIDCPDGYHDCNGCCVPYPCIGISLDY
ncbi:MAG TPA: hypothetical protein DC054_04170 [Blastocatellia bacterium]|nr:hypothetical protein [Blastocatellia bacterium]